MCLSLSSPLLPPDHDSGFPPPPRGPMESRGRAGYYLHIDGTAAYTPDCTQQFCVDSTKHGRQNRALENPASQRPWGRPLSGSCLKGKEQNQPRTGPPNPRLDRHSMIESIECCQENKKDQQGHTPPVPSSPQVIYQGSSHPKTSPDAELKWILRSCFIQETLELSPPYIQSPCPPQRDFRDWLVGIKTERIK